MSAARWRSVFCVCGLGCLGLSIVQVYYYEVLRACVGAQFALF